MDIGELTQRIKNFSLGACESGGQGYQRILLQLFGFLGHGKSSFINSCKYVLDDEDYVNHAGANMPDNRRTTARVSYKLTESITLVDNRGCEKMESYKTGEIFAQLGNILPLDVSIEWRTGLRLADKVMDAETEVSSSDFICPVFLYSIKKGIHREDVEDIKTLLQTAGQVTGIFPLVILTHKNYGRLTQMEGMFRNMGVEKIFSLENYTPEDHCRSRGRHEAILHLLYEVIKQARFSLQEPRDRIQEVKDRKQFIQRIICDMERCDRAKKDTQDQADMARWDKAAMDRQDQVNMGRWEWADRWEHPIMDHRKRTDMDVLDYSNMDRQNWVDMDRREQADMDRREQADMDRLKKADVDRQDPVDLNLWDHSEMERWHQPNIDRQDQVDVERYDKANMCREDHDDMNKLDRDNIDRRHYEEEIKNLTDKYELQRQCDQRRYEAEMREYQRMIQHLKKKSHCVLQ
ncbi:uncharacterized protein ACNLHF_025019 [Anomaloglossus baeobatrachus]|uniref:uncharacterized protein LOC142246837 n=1 Tax=Anomaloglossus baeobatrachus TaxID=238106 RepID=UPI003F503FB9